MRDGVLVATPERERCTRINIEDCYENCGRMFTGDLIPRCQEVCMREAAAECRHAEMMAKLEEIDGRSQRARIGIVNILHEIRAEIAAVKAIAHSV